MQTEKFKPVDGQTLLEMDLPPIRFVVDKLIPQGLHIFSGAAKTGKSWLLLLLSLKVTKGEPLWGFSAEKGTVLSLCLEDSLTRVQRRLLNLTDDAPSNLYFSTLSNSLSDGLLKQIENFIDEHSDTNLIIIDTLQKIRTNASDANPYAADYKDIGLLKEIADKHGITIIVVQHLRKQFDSDPHSMVTGSTGLLGAADGSYVLKRENVGDRNAKLFIKGRDVEELILNIRRNEDTNEWEFISFDTPMTDSMKSDQVIMLLISFMKTQKEFMGTASELSEILGGTVKSNVLTRKLKKYEKELKAIGIEYAKSRTGEQRELLIIYSPPDGNDDMTVPTLPPEEPSVGLKVLAKV